MNYWLRHPCRAFNNWHWDYFGMPFRLKFYWQRLRYGVADSDSWNFDEYLLNVITRGLKELIDGMGHPCYIYDEKNKEIYTYHYKYDGCEPEHTDEDTSTSSSKGAEVWDQVILDIITGLEAFKEARDNWYLTDSKEYKKCDKAFRKSMALLTNNFGSFWD